MKNIYENKDFIIYEDNKCFDFKFDIENKNNEEITIIYGDNEEEITIENWIGLFSEQKYIIDCILNNNYRLKVEEE